MPTNFMGFRHHSAGQTRIYHMAFAGSAMGLCFWLLFMGTTEKSPMESLLNGAQKKKIAWQQADKHIFCGAIIYSRSYFGVL